MNLLGKRVLFGCGLVLVLAAGLAAFGAWWFMRGSPVVDRLELVGPETQGFVTFLSVPEDKALAEVLDSLKQRSLERGGDKRAEWLGAIHDLISRPGIHHVRASALVEALPGGDSNVGFVLSLGKMANLVRMLLGIADSEREVEMYRDERIVHGHDKQDFSMSFVGNNLILSRDVRALKTLIDRLKSVAISGKPSEKMEGILKDIDPRREMPGYGAFLNDKGSMTGIWRLYTQAPEDSEIILPETFEGAGFRFGFASSDTLRGDGYFYFADEEAAAGAIDQLKAGIARMCGHFHLKPDIDVQQEGRRLRVAVEAKGLQSALDHYFPKTN